MRFALIHRFGCNCVAAYFRLPPASPTEPFSCEDVLLLDGTRPAPDEPIACGACAKWLNRRDLAPNNFAYIQDAARA